MRKSDLPFGAQFSPNQVELAEVLEIVHAHPGQGVLATEALRARFFHGNAPNQQLELAKNVPLALYAYQLVDRATFTFTEMGRQLYDGRRDSRELYGRLARHILLRLRGLDLLDAIRDLQSAGHPVTLESIARRLELYGIHVPPSAVHVSSMRLWLEKAGVFRSGYEIVEPRVQDLVGASPSELEALAGLDERQRDFLKALATLGEGPHDAARVREHARSLYGTDFPYKSMPKAVLDSLQARGWVNPSRELVSGG